VCRFYDLAYEINPEAYVAWALALASLGVHLALDYFLRGDMSVLLGSHVDVETLALVGLSVLLVLVLPPPPSPTRVLAMRVALMGLCLCGGVLLAAAVAVGQALIVRQYVVLVQEERRRRAHLGAHLHQD
jgi:hypothetical protein